MFLAKLESTTGLAQRSYRWRGESRWREGEDGRVEKDVEKRKRTMERGKMEIDSRE